MALIIYNQTEVDEMIAMRKYFIENAWRTRTSSRWGEDGGGQILKAVSENPDDGHEFEVWLETHNLDTFSFTLRGRKKPRDFENLARYDIQNNEHPNPPWFRPDRVLPRTFHKHVYNHRANFEHGRWDFCATPILGISQDGSPDTLKQRLQGKFFADMNLHFSEPNTASSLFGGGT
jgi:hypothetical protein